jgi:hypothetical protein
MLIDLCSLAAPLTREQGLYMVTKASRHVLYGPEVLLVRSATLTTLRDARFRVLAEMPYRDRAAHKEE